MRGAREEKPKLGSFSAHGGGRTATTLECASFAGQDAGMSRACHGPSIFRLAATLRSSGCKMRASEQDFENWR
jgi:hypothetical protein